MKAVIRTGNTIPLNEDGQSSIMLKYKKLEGFTVRCNGSLLSYYIKNDVIEFDAIPSEEYVIQRDK